MRLATKIAVARPIGIPQLCLTSAGPKPMKVDARSEAKMLSKSVSERHRMMTTRRQG